MSNNKKIRYSIFSSRKNFNILKWIKNSSNKTYEEFKDFLESKNIVPPAKAYFEKAVNFYNSTKITKCSINKKQVEEPVVEEPVVEEPVAKEPVAKEQVAKEQVAKEPVVESKPKTKQRRRTRRTTKSKK